MRTAEPVTVTEIGFFSVKIKRPIRPDGYADDTIVNSTHRLIHLISNYKTLKVRQRLFPIRPSKLLMSNHQFSVH